MNMGFVVCLLFCLSLGARAQEGQRVLMAWDFAGTQAEGWTPARHLPTITVADGILSGRAEGHDPQLVSPLFDLPATPFQEVWARVKSNRAGRGELFFTNTTEGQYGGFSAAKLVHYTIDVPDQWQVIRIRPFWQAEKRIVRLRLDPLPESAIEVDWIRIVAPAGTETPLVASAWTSTQNGCPDGWTRPEPNHWVSPLLATPVEGLPWVSLDLATPCEGVLNLRWATDTASGLQHTWQFLGRDGLRHRIQVDMGHRPAWSGRLLMLDVQVTTQDNVEAVLHSVALRGSPEEAPDLHVLSFGQQDGINRVDRPAAFLLRLVNRGGRTATGVRIAAAGPPQLGEITVSPDVGDGIALEPDIPRDLVFTVTPGSVGRYALEATIEAPGVGRITSTPMAVLPAYALSGTTTIPEPKPAATPYLVGSYYYPGFGTERQWRELERSAPWAKPVLGYYDEGKIECVDWQIKWAAEHGVSFFLVDWYWTAGNRRYLHWLDAFAQARFRSYMKWAVMWANHNPPGTHSETDWRAVTQYWIDHYFHTPEYLRCEGRPVVALWSPGNLRNDTGGTEAARRLLDLAQEMARSAGLPGIYFVAMNQPPSALLVSEGYAAITQYHGWSDSRGMGGDANYWPFAQVVARARKGWNDAADLATGHGLSLWPVADTGWDARPRHGDNTFVIYGRTPERFRQHLQDAKAWLDQRGQRLLVLGPWNEWTEGSYIEPCAEWGFDMLRAIHGTFCTGAPPPIVGPRDVGLGPYDFDLTNAEAHCRDWPFAAAADALRWKPLMGLNDVTVTTTGLAATVTTHDPAFISPWLELPARTIAQVEVTLTVEPPRPGDTLTLFWATATAPCNSRAWVSLPLATEAGPQTYVLHPATHAAWRGVIRQLRLDPCTTAETTVRLERVRLLP